MRRVLVASGLALVLAVPAAGEAPAAAPWSALAPLAAPDLARSPVGPRDLVRDVALQRSAGDRLTVTWSQAPATRTSLGLIGPIAYRTRVMPLDGRPRRPRLTAADGAVVAYGGERHLLAAATRVTVRGRVSDIGVQTLRFNRFTVPRRLARGTDLSPPVIAATPRGDLAVAWTTNYPGRGRKGGRLMLSLRPAGGVFSRPSVLVGRGLVDHPQLAFGPDGTLVVAYDVLTDARRGTRRIAVRVKRPGRPFARAQELGLGAYLWSGAAQLAVATSADGRSYVAFQPQPRAEGFTGSAPVLVAVRQPGSDRFGAATTLSPGGGANGTPAGRLCLAVDGRGGAAVAWSNPMSSRGARADADTWPVTLARTRDGRTWSQTPVSSSGAPRGLAFAGDGRLLVAWLDAPDIDHTGARVLAALAPSLDAPLGPVEEVAGRGSWQSADAGFTLDGERATVALSGVPGAPPAPYLVNPMGPEAQVLAAVREG